MRYLLIIEDVEEEVVGTIRNFDNYDIVKIYENAYNEYANVPEDVRDEYFNCKEVTEKDVIAWEKCYKFKTLIDFNGLVSPETVLEVAKHL